MCGDFPPSSRATGISLLAATAAIRRPLAVPPVKDSILTPGCATRAAPASAPLPGSTSRTPGGRPASSAMRPSSSAVDGVNSDGFRITALPAASAGATFCASMVIGEFQGVMAATTPYGSCTVIET